MIRRSFQGHLSRRGYVVLDGGLSTELERRGHALTSRLWSAHLLRTDPGAILQGHRAFLDAGADCITTASYQASFWGFAEAGISEPEGARLFRLSSELALQARAEWLDTERGASVRDARDVTPLIAASIGPYGAYLADGSEYEGRYEVSPGTLRDFHDRRLHLLAGTGVDLLACETIPNAREAEVLLRILDEDPDGVPAWLSFSCRDRARLSDGTPLEEVVDLCRGHPRVVAVGVNCTRPSFLGELMGRAGSVSDVTLIAYPNSGERYEASTGTWERAGDPRESWLKGVLEAREAGADVVGGCCRVSPEDIRMLRDALEGRD